MDDDHRRANLFHSSLDYQLFDKSKKIFSDKNSYFPFKASKYITKNKSILFFLIDSYLLHSIFKAMHLVRCSSIPSPLSLSYVVAITDWCRQILI
jgi:hypothetical protein